MKVLGIHKFSADINLCEFQMTSGWQPTAFTILPTSPAWMFRDTTLTDTFSPPLHLSRVKEPGFSMVHNQCKWFHKVYITWACQKLHPLTKSWYETTTDNPYAQLVCTNCPVNLEVETKKINLSAMFDLGDSADGSSGILCPNTEALAARQLKTGS